MKSEPVGLTVLLTDFGVAATLAGRLVPLCRPIVAYAGLEELLRGQTLASISVLVFHFHPAPKGVLLSVIARIALEFPDIQMIAVIEGSLALPVVEYLTACGVHLIWAESREEDIEKLVSVVDQVHERARWVATRRD